MTRRGRLHAGQLASDNAGKSSAQRVVTAGSLERLAHHMGVERPTFLKQALRRGAADLVFEGACQAYRNGTATLSRAAEMAELGLRDMILWMRDADLELNHDVSDLRKDLQP